MEKDFAQVTPEWLIAVGFKRVEKDSSCDDELYSIKFDRDSDKWYPHELRYHLNKICKKDYSILYVYIPEEKGIPCPTNENLDNTIDQEEEWIPIAYNVSDRIRLQHLIFSMTENYLEPKSL